ncbi:hypothetical protein NIES267_06710 [Calothrix parasitica NIES-267]|uniref:Uncharacterized protein n=1 Tax=Calothrix parasitica NIES-267 TaxID=1973488 RepID=A0A1Z4LIY6_9CYAN|nr:hypothetical protein NIES267_06710 [Calothrix parasitica NIES-267]
MCKNIICHCEWNEVERRIHPKGVAHRKTLRLLHFVRNDNHNLNFAKLGCSLKIWVAINCPIPFLR